MGAAGRRGRVYRIGVDEAGRGSLVGEMIVAAFAVPVDRLGVLVEAGVADSKELTPAARARLYPLLASLGVFAVVPVRPWEIDRENLNKLTEDAVVRAVGAVLRRLGGAPVEAVVVDRFGHPSGLRGRLRRIGVRAPVIIEERADAKYPEVSAASIIAKYIRDRRIGVLRSLYGVRGSGYPSDPETVAWVLETVERGLRPPVIRYSWGTLKGTGVYVDKRAARRGRVRTLDEFMGGGDG